MILHATLGAHGCCTRLCHCDQMCAESACKIEAFTAGNAKIGLESWYTVGVPTCGGDMDEQRKLTPVEMLADPVIYEQMRQTVRAAQLSVVMMLDEAGLLPTPEARQAVMPEGVVMPSQEIPPC